MEVMKKYVLADAEAQKAINLRDYGEEISFAIFDAVGDEDEMTVTTCEDCYYTDLERSLTGEEEAFVEERLRDSELDQYRTADGAVFKSIEVPVKELFPNGRY